MNFQFYLEKLRDSVIFKRFLEENPEAYLCSGFFTLDKEGKDNQRHIDFYSFEKKQIFSFKLDSEVEILPTEKDSELRKDLPILEKISENVDFELEEIEKLIEKEIAEKEIKTKVQKIIISLQNVKGKILLICTVFISMLGLLKVQIDLTENEPKIVLFEKKSFFDFVKRVK